MTGTAGFPCGCSWTSSSPSGTTVEVALCWEHAQMVQAEAKLLTTALKMAHTLLDPRTVRDSRPQGGP